MRINVAVPEPYVEAPVLDAALEGVTRLNERLIESGDVPTFAEAVNRVRWKPEPPGAEHFDHAAVVLGRGWGDCDDLAPWHAASLRVTGEDPEAEAVVKRSGPNRWHAIVRRSDGSIDDPSLAAGMPGPGQRAGVAGAVVPLMFPAVSGVDGAYIARPQLAMRPSGEAWNARIDLPWHHDETESPSDIAMVSLHRSPVSDQALVGALRGAVALGEVGEADEEHLDRLCCIADALEGVPWEDLADEYGPEHANAAGEVVGSFFGGLLKKAKGAIRSVAKNPLRAAVRAAIPIPGMGKYSEKLFRGALPIASQFAQFIPGVGPVAQKALQAASPMLLQSLSRGTHQPPGPMRHFAQQAAHMAMQQAPNMMPGGFGGMMPGGFGGGFGGGGMGPFSFG